MEERWDVSTQEFLYRMSRLGMDLGPEGMIRHLLASWRKAKETRSTFSSTPPTVRDLPPAPASCQWRVE